MTPYIVVETPKYTIDSSQILGLMRTCQRFSFFRPDSTCCSKASLSSSQALSSPFSQPASRGLSASAQNTVTPRKMAGTPSIRNIHCHPESPRPLNPSNAPETGLPMMPARGFAVMNQATARARALAGNQRFI